MPRGRPTKFKPEYVRQVQKLTELGATDEDIAVFFDVAERTVHNWRNSDPKFQAASDTGKAVADTKVERSLFERATGYSHPEEKVFCNKDGEVTRVDTTKHYAPDTTACIFWLKNRKPKEWRDRTEVDATVRHSLESLVTQSFETGQ